ncbi:MAG: hypothetical protein V2A64_06220 [Candidatus Omnitrophota bacterium]
MEWTIVFAALLAVSAMFQVPLKRAVQKKIVLTADYVLWNKWKLPNERGDISKLEPPEKNVHVLSTATQQQKATVSEDKDGKITSSLKGIDSSKPTRIESRVSSSVEEGSEALLKLFNF